MKVRMLMAAMLFSGVCWAQTNDLERLNRIVYEQGKEIELLKAQLARIESALAINGNSTPTIRQAALVTMVQQVPQPAPTAQQIQEQQRAIVTQALAGKWYERFALRGYTQIRYSNVFSGTGPELEVPADRSVNENESLMIRRGRFVLAGDATNHLALYAQMDFNASTGAPDFSVQMRDLYADVSIDSGKQFRFRLGQSKVPFGWSNMQSSQNRGPLERPDGINSAAEGERDLGAYFMWASSEAKQRFRDMGTLKGTGDYGVVALGVYSGQGPNRADQNGMVHTVARATYPFKFANGQFFELGVQGYHGRFVTPTQAITDRGTSITPTLPSRGVTDQRAGLSAVWYPQPLGIEVEWNVGQGPELSADLRRIESNFLHGGYAQMNFRRVRQGSPSWFPFARWNYFDGGRKFARNAPKSKVNELDLGFEFSPWPEVEITPVFTRTFQRTRTGSFPYDTTRNANRLGVQLQLNY